jgi:hypothetical protein
LVLLRAISTHRWTSRPTVVLVQPPTRAGAIQDRTHRLSLDTHALGEADWIDRQHTPWVGMFDAIYHYPKENVSQ